MVRQVSGLTREVAGLKASCNDLRQYVVELEGRLTQETGQWKCAACSVWSEKKKALLCAVCGAARH